MELTHPDGTFVIGGLVPGSYFLQVVPLVGPGGEESDLGRLDLPDVAAGTEDLEIVLQTIELTRGFVHDADGNPLNLVEVRAVDAAGETLVYDHSNPEGHFALSIEGGLLVTLIAIPFDEGEKPFYMPREVVPGHCAHLEDVVSGSGGHRLVLPRGP